MSKELDMPNSLLTPPLWHLDMGCAGGPEDTTPREQMTPKEAALNKELDMSNSLLTPLWHLDWG